VSFLFLLKSFRRAGHGRGNCSATKTIVARPLKTGITSMTRQWPLIARRWCADFMLLRGKRSRLRGCAATQLSIISVNAGPSREELLALAENGQIMKPAVVAQAYSRLLRKKRAARFVGVLPANGCGLAEIELHGSPTMACIPISLRFLQIDGSRSRAPTLAEC